MDYVGAILKNTKLLADMAGASVIGRAVIDILRGTIRSGLLVFRWRLMRQKNSGSGFPRIAGLPVLRTFNLRVM